MASKLDGLPKAFIWRRLHSLMGLWLVIFLIEHLITNSQAALLLGESGKGFVRMVNALHNLPYLTVIEVALLGVPILIHGIWGIKYALTSKSNSTKGDGTRPGLKYGRNRAYTWQRITSWILLVLLTLHIVKFRFLEYPGSVNTGTSFPTYFVTSQMDPGLYSVADRLGVTLYDAKQLEQMRVDKGNTRRQRSLSRAADEIYDKESSQYSSQDETIVQSAQSYEEEQKRREALSNVKLKPDEVLATSPSFGTVTLLTVRDTFKSPIWVGIYTIFVLSAVFHAFNGLWTSMLTWGWVINKAGQTKARKLAITLMILIGFLGLAAIWGTYFLNLKT